MTGLVTLAVIAIACFATAPWTLGWLGETGEAAPYKRQNLSAQRLPPFWAPHGESDAERVREASFEIMKRRLEADGVEREPTEDEVLRARPRPALGTDHLGRDLLTRCLAGGTVSIGIGLAAAAISVVIGTLYGALAGASGGRIDAAMMRIVDILFGLPYILLVVLLAVAADAVIERWVARGGRLGEGGLAALNVLTLLVAIGGVSWLTMARVIRGQTMSLCARPFMEAARAIGASPARQFRKHLLPNLAGTIIVYATLTAPQAMLQESFLSFLGIGVRPPLPSWGGLVAEGLAELNLVKPRWWLLLFPSLLLGVTLLALNFVGEGLREAIDPGGGAGRA